MRVCPAQVAWVGALKGVIMAMHGFVKQHHPDAVRWNKSGCPLSDFKPSASGAGKQLTSRHAKHFAYDAEGAWGPLRLVDSRQCFHQVDLPVCACFLAWFLLCARLRLPAVIWSWKYSGNSMSGSGWPSLQAMQESK